MKSDGGPGLIAQARAGDERAFAELIEPYRRELQVHCYRFLGSVQDAEDVLQEIMLAAWQDLASFEGRSSLRTWLYRVATHRCLNALRTARRRPQIDWPPPGIDLPMATGRNEVTWLEPYPDAWLEGRPDIEPGPEARYEALESISLAFITALQLLPARQRAALILRDALGFSAREAAGILRSSEESLTSALKRARAGVRGSMPASPGPEPPPPPGSAAERDLVTRLARAYQSGSVDDLVALLAEDVLLTMPPIPLEYQGRELVARFMAAFVFRGGNAFRLIATRANGQPAFGMYLAEPGSAGTARANGVMVFTLSGDRISGMTRFDTSALPLFGLPSVLPASAGD